MYTPSKEKFCSAIRSSRQETQAITADAFNVEILTYKKVGTQIFETKNFANGGHENPWKISARRCYY